MHSGEPVRKRREIQIRLETCGDRKTDAEHLLQGKKGGVKQIRWRSNERYWKMC